MFKRTLVIASVVTMLAIAAVAPAYARANDCTFLGNRYEGGTAIQIDGMAVYRCSDGSWEYVW
jgi:hypothetical protein